MYRTLVFAFAAMLFATAVQAAKTYMWKDDRGITHFSTRQPPRSNSDKTRLQGGAVAEPGSESDSQPLARIKRKDLINPGWQGCKSSLCRLVQQIDSNCQTSLCSRAKRYSNGCTSAACLTKKLAFESDVQGRVATQNGLRQQQAIDASAAPTAPEPEPASRLDN
jgi:hypothetical protein